MPYASDFGPLDLGCIYRYCNLLDSFLNDPKLHNSIIYHYTSLIPAKRANAALLMGCYQIIRLERTAEESWEYFQNVSRFIPYRDASPEGSPFELYILDCLKGLEKAMQLGWFSIESFNLEEYENFARVECGGLNWIIPKKILAFSAPSDGQGKNSQSMSPDQYSLLFKQLGVTTVIKLNKERYDHQKFIKFGLSFYELYFLDGSVPSDEIIEEFLNIADTQRGGIAVHCKAGLGRTGTLIGCYAIKEFKFTAPEFIGWARLCRPGSILGPQQFFLCEFEEKIGKKYIVSNVSDISRVKSPQVPLRGEMTLFEKYKAKFGEIGQSEKLTQMMKSAPSSPLNFPNYPSRGNIGNLKISQPPNNNSKHENN